MHCGSHWRGKSRFSGGSIEYNGGDLLDLRNNTITVGELLDNEKARAVFQRRFGKWMKHPMLSAGRSLTLGQLMELARVYLPQKTIQDTWKELKEL